jgi:hypothetical protein
VQKESDYHFEIVSLSLSLSTFKRIKECLNVLEIIDVFVENKNGKVNGENKYDTIEEGFTG